MKLNHLLAVHTLVALVYGAALFLIPETLYSLRGINSTPGTVLVGQLFGSVLIIVALIVWQARGIDDARARRAICLANVPGFAVGSLVARRGSLAGVAGSLGWPVVVLYAFFALAYAYFLWPDRAERRTTQAARPN